MKDEKMILYVQTSNAPERQYSPLVLAQIGQGDGPRTRCVYYLGMGLTMLQPGRSSRRSSSARFPSVREMLDKTLADGHPGLRVRGVASRCSAGRRSSSSTA